MNIKHRYTLQRISRFTSMVDVFFNVFVYLLFVFCSTTICMGGSAVTFKPNGAVAFIISDSRLLYIRSLFTVLYSYCNSFSSLAVVFISLTVLSAIWPLAIYKMANTDKNKKNGTLAVTHL